MTFSWSKEILRLHLKYYIFRSYQISKQSDRVEIVFKEHEYVQMSKIDYFLKSMIKSH